MSPIYEEPVAIDPYSAPITGIEYVKCNGSSLSSQPTCKEHSRCEVDQPFSKQFFQSSASIAKARALYLKAFVRGTIIVTLMIFAVFSIFWGVLWKAPVRPLQGIIVDFDGGSVGSNVTLGILSRSNTIIEWEMASVNEFPAGPSDLIHALKNDRTWVAIAINSGASGRLEASLSTPDASYNGEDAVTVYASEARSENVYRNLIRPIVTAALDSFKLEFSIQFAQQAASSPNIVPIMAISPQTIVNPISYTHENVLPFSQPVATAATFVGMIFNLILSFFVVMIGYGAREASGLARNLRLKSLILLRLGSLTSAYFIVSLFYSLLNKAFQLNMSVTFGRGGFMSFWMLNWVGLLATGLALDAMITLLTHRFIIFFLLFWIITNASVCILPIEILPVVFRYGYAMPFYNISHAIRTISMGTRNQVGLNFGVLLAWVAVSCTTLPLFQWFIRSREVKAYQQVQRVEAERPGDEKICSMVQVGSSA